jgi:hypothetical protein
VQERFLIPFDENFARNMDATGSHGNNPCILCGRRCPKPRYKVYVDSGFTHLLTMASFQQDAGEMGLFPVGMNCLCKHPEIQPYIQIESDHLDEQMNWSTTTEQCQVYDPKTRTSQEYAITHIVYPGDTFGYGRILLPRGRIARVYWSPDQNGWHR